MELISIESKLPVELNIINLRESNKLKFNSFTRKRKTPLNDIILCTLCKKGLTTVMELRQYFLQKNNKIINISKQGYLQQRRRLNYKVFSLLNKKYLQDFYLNHNKILWNGYLDYLQMII